MRVVLDTNVLLSACWKPGGLESRTISLALSGRFTVCVTREVWAEYADVLRRPKFAELQEEAHKLLATLEAIVLQLQPVSRIDAALDSDDNRFLECAETAAATYLVTGNLRHYPSSWGATSIVNARAFLSKVAPEQLL